MSQTIGERIKELREYYELSQAAFGEKVGVGYAAIGLYENNKRNVKERVRQDICREFKCSYLWLSEGEGEMLVNEDDDLMLAIDLVMTGEDDFHKQLIAWVAGFDKKEIDTIKGMMKKFIAMQNKQ